MCQTIWKWADTRRITPNHRLGWMDFKRGDLVSVIDDGIDLGLVPTKDFFRVFVHPGLAKEAFDPWLEVHIENFDVVQPRRYHLALDAPSKAARTVRQWTATNRVLELSPQETQLLLSLKRDRAAPVADLVLELSCQE